MTCHMGEFVRRFLWSSCDQCGKTAEFQYFQTQENGPSQTAMRDARDDWNKHHKGSSTAKGIKVPEFTHEWAHFIVYV